MSVEGWTVLWTALLWGSVGAFAIVGLYILGGLLRSMAGRKR